MEPHEDPARPMLVQLGQAKLVPDHDLHLVVRSAHSPLAGLNVAPPAGQVGQHQVGPPLVGGGAGPAGAPDVGASAAAGAGGSPMDTRPPTLMHANVPPAMPHSRLPSSHNPQLSLLQNAPQSRFPMFDMEHAPIAYPQFSQDPNYLVQNQTQNQNQPHRNLGMGLMPNMNVNVPVNQMAQLPSHNQQPPHQGPLQAPQLLQAPAPPPPPPQPALTSLPQQQLAQQNHMPLDNQSANRFYQPMVNPYGYLYQPQYVMPEPFESGLLSLLLSYNSNPMYMMELLLLLKYSTPPAKPPQVPETSRNLCPVCRKLFKRPLLLQIHFYIHTGVKLYKCEWEGCGRLFNVKSNMKRHYRLHLKREQDRRTHESQG